VRFYGEKEGDEILDTYEYMRLNPSPQEEVISPYDKTTGLSYTIQIRNQYLIDYSLHKFHRINQEVPFTETELYRGNLSAKTVTVNLPVKEGEAGEMFLQIRNRSNITILETFGVLYKVGKKCQRINGTGP
jgi:hypothetical protein